MITLNTESSIPLYKQLYNLLTEQISKGLLKPGDKIPSEGQLVELYNISRVTVRAAIEMMVKEGILIKRHGKGTYVAMPIFVESKAGGSFTKSCLQNNVVPHTEVLSVDTVSCPSEAARYLQVEEGTPVHRICRVRYTDQIPVIFEVDYFRKSDDYILHGDFENMLMSDIIFSHTGLNVQQFEDVFDINIASKEQAKMLKCPTGTPLLTVHQIVMTTNRQILYYNEQNILTDRYKYAVNYN